MDSTMGFITILHHHLGEYFWFTFSKHRGQAKSKSFRFHFSLPDCNLITSQSTNGYVMGFSGGYLVGYILAHLR